MEEATGDATVDAIKHDDALHDKVQTPTPSGLITRSSKASATNGNRDSDQKTEAVRALNSNEINEIPKNAFVYRHMQMVTFDADQNEDIKPAECGDKPQTVKDALADTVAETMAETAAQVEELKEALVDHMEDAPELPFGLERTPVTIVKVFIPYWDSRTKRIKSVPYWDSALVVVAIVVQSLVFTLSLAGIMDLYWAFVAIGFGLNAEMLAFGLPEERSLGRSYLKWCEPAVQDTTLPQAVGRFERAVYVVTIVVSNLVWILWPMLTGGGYSVCSATSESVTIPPTPRPPGSEDSEGKGWSRAPEGDAWRHTVYFINLFFCPLICTLILLTIVQGHASTPYAACCLRCLNAMGVNAAAVFGVAALSFCDSQGGGYDAVGGLLDGLFSSWGLVFVWTAVLVVRRTAALAATTRRDGHMQFLVMTLQGSGLLILSGYAIMKWLMLTATFFKILAGGLVCCGLLIFCAFGWKVWQSFRVPLEQLTFEIAHTTGAPQLEAIWAKKVLSRESWATVATMGTSIMYASVLLYFLEMDEDDQSYSQPISYVIDVFTNSISIIVLSGVLESLWKPQAKGRPQKSQYQKGHMKNKVVQPRAIVENEMSQFQHLPEWQNKVRELAGRGFTLEQVLDFYSSLGGKAMKHYRPDRHTTNDVVRQVIIPASKLGEGGGRALASVWNDEEEFLAERMVTHNWDNVFCHLVSAMVADGLGEPIFDSVVTSLKDGNAEGLKKQLAQKNTLQRRYWVCAFCVNQHACICGGFGPPPPEGTAKRNEWERKKIDTVTQKEYPLCTCQQPKVFNDQPVPCEVNKFDSLMSLLMDELGVERFGQVVACDKRFELFHRAWCVAELVEADSMGMRQDMVIFSKDALDRNYKKLAALDVQECQASREEDKIAILSKIDDFEAFNERLQWLIFGQGGLLSQWMDGQAKIAGVGRLLQRMARQSTCRSMSSTCFSNSLPEVPYEIDKE